MSKEKSKGGVVHLDDVPARTMAHGARFEMKSVGLGTAAGGDKLRCSQYEIAPGKRAFPFHAHHGLEESIYVLCGEATLRLGDDELALRPGSYAAFPAGGHAHQVINTGTETLRYLCMSAASGWGADVVTYPDSNKVLASAGDWGTQTFSHRGIYWDKDQPGYFDGEDAG